MLDERRFHGNFVKNRECKFRTPGTISRKKNALIDLTKKKIPDNFTD